MTWLEPVGIPNNPQWGTMDVGPDGSLYLAADREQTVWRISRR